MLVSGVQLSDSVIYIYRHVGASQVMLVVKNLSANAGDIRDVGWIPGLGRSPGEGNGYPLQFPCLENPMDRGAWKATVHGVAKSWTWPQQLEHASIDFIKWWLSSLWCTRHPYLTLLVSLMLPPLFWPASFLLCSPVIFSIFHICDISICLSLPDISV